MSEAREGKDGEMANISISELEDTLALAVNEARQLNQDHVGTEHILLALTVAKDSTVAKVLSDIGVIPEKLRAGIAARRFWSEKIGLTPRAKRAIDRAMNEAQSSGSGYCGGKHLLWAILIEENMASAILEWLVRPKLYELRERVATL